jgi:hypothetical protein
MIAGIAVIARHRRDRKNKGLPQIYADERGSEKTHHGGTETRRRIKIGKWGKLKSTAEVQRRGESDDREKMHFVPRAFQERKPVLMEARSNAVRQQRWSIIPA